MWNRERVAVSLIFLVHGLVVAAWVSRIPAIQAAHSLTPGGLGTVLLAIPAASLIAMPLTGSFVHWWGARRVVMVSTLLFCASLPPIGFANDAWWLAAALALFGAAAGTMDVSMNAQAVELEHKADRPMLSGFHAMFSLGGMAGAGVGGALAAAGWAPLTWFLWCSAAFVLLSSIAFPWLPATREESGHTFAFRFTRRLVVLGVILFCVMLGEGAMADWTAVYLRSELRTGPGVAALGFAVFSGCMAGGRLVGDRLAVLAGRTRLLRTGAWLAAAGVAIAVVATVPWLAIAGFACVGAGFATAVPLAYAAAGRERSLPAGASIAAVTTVGYTGFLIGPPFIGFTAEITGLRGALALVAVLAFVAGALVSSRNVEAP